MNTVKLLGLKHLCPVLEVSDKYWVSGALEGDRVEWDLWAMGVAVENIKVCPFCAEVLPTRLAVTIAQAAG